MYGKYELTAMQQAAGWQVHIYPTSSRMLKPSPDYAYALDIESAFAAAMLLVDQTSN
jgi:hypothetical protein